MTSLIMFIFGTIGMTNLVVESKFFSKFREIMADILPEEIYEVFECHQCSGTWCGLICGFLTWGFRWETLILSACAGGFIASLAYMVMQYLEVRTITYGGEEET